uniref:Uncharacterized protein n=1 Tax=Phlebotomus papatasi TaxID=29031 RepID=A0A1B0D3B9_PHLPP
MRPVTGLLSMLTKNYISSDQTSN